jgi:hypothetical protein
VAVAGERKLGLQLSFVEGFALLEEEGVGRQKGGRRHAQQSGGGRHDQHVGLAAADFVQRGQTLRHQVLVRGKRIVGQGFPVRQLMAAQGLLLVIGEPGNFRQQPLRVICGGDDDGEHALLRPEFDCRLRQHEGIGRAVHGRENETIARLGEEFFRIE